MAAANAAVATSATPFLVRKRCATAFLGDLPPRAAKHGRFSPCTGPAAAERPSLEFNPLDALRRIFPGVAPQDLEAYFDASGRDIHATVEAFRARQAREAAARATDNGGGMDECAAVLVEQMAAATDIADAKNRASWILALIKDAVAERAAAGLRGENAALKAQAASSSMEAAGLREENAGLKAQAISSSAEITKLREENAAMKAQAAALERDNAVLKRGVVFLHGRQEETERTISEMKKKVAELEMANYALTVRLGDADSCRFQAFHDAF